jgi:hypothetical protein
MFPYTTTLKTTLNPPHYDSRKNQSFHFLPVDRDAFFIYLGSGISCVCKEDITQKRTFGNRDPPLKIPRYYSMQEVFEDSFMFQYVIKLTAIQVAT